MHAPADIRTSRLHMRRPRPGDALAIHAYAADADITKYMAWPRHQALQDTHAFLTQSDAEWDQVGVGTYLICDQVDGQVLGSTGLHLATPYRSVTGYILLRHAWGNGYATEACRAMVELARRLGLFRIEADCHVDHAASARVLEKAGLLHEGLLRSFLLFPNLDEHKPHDVHLYGLAL